LLALVFGNTVYAVGVVLTAFMSGLSLGSLLLGKIADRRPDILKLYGVLELGIAAFAAMSPFLLGKVTAIYVSAYQASTPLWVLSLIRYGLSAIVLLVPTTLMGGTLPVLSRYFVRSESELESRVGILYSINTMGGVFGTFLVGFFLVRYLGLSFTIKLAVFVNICIGMTVFILGSVFPEARTVAVEAGTVEGERPPGYRYALTAFFLSGFSAMVYEVAWNRLLVNVIGSTTYAFSLVLIGFLVGIGLGSLVVSRISRRKKLGMLHFSGIQAAIGITGFLTIVIFNYLPILMLNGIRFVGGSYGNILVVEFLLVILYVIFPTTLFGATFPIIAGIYNDGSGNRGRNIGNIYAANTAGCILGSAVAAFLFLPYLGSGLSIKVATVINVLLGGVGFLVLKNYRSLAFASALIVVPFLPVNITQELLSTGVSIYGAQSEFSLHRSDLLYVYSKEGLNATISVEATQDGVLSLRTNGKVDASTTPEDMSTQLALGYFPMILHAEPKDVLIVGLGSGVTVKAVYDFPGVKQVECVEIEPAVTEAADYFARVNGRVHRNPDFKIVLEDARNYIIASKKHYDVIISEPSNPWISGIGNLFSREFYQASKEKLRGSGIFCQWVQLYGLRQEDLLMILKTFISVFPNTTVWQSGASDILLIGSMEKIEMYDYKSIDGRIPSRAKWDLAAYLNIRDPLDFLSYFITDSEGIASALKNINVNTDDLPLLEFNAPYSLYIENANVSNNLLLQQYARFPVVSTDNMSREKVFPELLYRKSRNYHKLGIPADPAWIGKAVEDSQQNADYIVQMAKQSISDDRVDEGKALLKKALGIAPGNPPANYEYGMLSMKDPSGDAERYFNKVGSGKENEFIFYFDVAQYKLSLGKTEESLDYFIRALDIPHSRDVDWRIFSYLAVCYNKLKDYNRSAYFLRKSVESNPYNFDTTMSMATMELYFGRRDSACRYFEYLMKVVPEDRRDAIKNMMVQYCPN
jgi:spermidine synthase